MIRSLLALLRTPRSMEDLCRELGASRPVVDGMLRLLEAKGYVGHAYDDSPACGTSCGGCGMKRLCPASGMEAPFLAVWRLTVKGEGALERYVGSIA